jgi:hypothetical protein
MNRIMFFCVIDNWYSISDCLRNPITEKVISFVIACRTFGSHFRCLPNCETSGLAGGNQSSGRPDYKLRKAYIQFINIVLKNTIRTSRYGNLRI